MDKPTEYLEVWDYVIRYGEDPFYPHGNEGWRVYFEGEPIDHDEVFEDYDEAIEQADEDYAERLKTDICQWISQAPLSVHELLDLFSCLENTNWPTRELPDPDPGTARWVAIPEPPNQTGFLPGLAPTDPEGEPHA